MVSVDEPHEDTVPWQCSSRVPGVLGCMNRALKLAVPAYWGGSRAHGSSGGHEVRSEERASYAVLGAFGGAVLSAMVSIVLGSMWNQEAVIASAPGARYTMHAGPRIESDRDKWATKLVSPFVYAAYLSSRPTDVTGYVEVSFNDGPDDAGVPASCRYVVFEEQGAAFGALRGDPPAVMRDSLERPVRITYGAQRTYGAQEVPRDSRVGRSIEERCDEILEASIPALNASSRTR